MRLAGPGNASPHAWGIRPKTDRISYSGRLGTIMSFLWWGEPLRRRINRRHGEFDVQLLTQRLHLGVWHIVQVKMIHHQSADYHVPPSCCMCDFFPGPLLLPESSSFKSFHVLNGETRGCLKINSKFVDPVRQIRVSFYELTEYLLQIPVAHCQGDMLNNSETD